MINWNFKNVNYITCDSDLVLPPLVSYYTPQSVEVKGHTHPGVQVWVARETGEACSQEGEDVCAAFPHVVSEILSSVMAEPQ